ncbi:hypothetical protein [Leclercia adecarboxylata]|uniref:hypothetical protein n=1 Tax=Leclercia adecarboxylata TaxID=83655 RepID=UPI001643D323|nr:hypothetical protein [Leclercia adecarboxylata]
MAEFLKKQTSIDAIFDREKERCMMEEAQLIAKIGVQVADNPRTQGKINMRVEARTLT